MNLNETPAKPDISRNTATLPRSDFYPGTYLRGLGTIKKAVDAASFQRTISSSPSFCEYCPAVLSKGRHTERYKKVTELYKTEEVAYE